jgi:hypothetical protein
MSQGRRPLVAGNWKMNSGSPAEFARMLEGARGLPAIDVMVCPPFTLVAELATVARGSPVRIGGQDCHAEAAGAFTGDVSAEMLKAAGSSGDRRTFRAPYLSPGNRRRCPRQGARGAPRRTPGDRLRR